MRTSRPLPYAAVAGRWLRFVPDLEADLARLKTEAAQASTNAAMANVKAEQKREQLKELSTKLASEFGCQTWGEAAELLTKLGVEAEQATETARAALVAEGIIA